MRRTFALLVIAIVGATMPVSIAATQGAGDFVTGAGEFESTGMVFRFSFNARGDQFALNFSDQSFKPAQGRAVISFGDDVRAKGTINCMRGTFNSGFVEGTFDEPAVFAGVTFPGFFIGFADLGEPGDPTPDFAQIHLHQGTPCIGSNGPGFGNFLTHGNIVVMNREPF